MKNLSFLKRFNFALQGICGAWRTESSFRLQLLAIPLVAVSLVFLRAGATWWAIIALTSGSVLAAELFNTALEKLIDQVHPEQHPSIKIAKDCAAGAVLILSFTSIFVFISFLCARFLAE